MAHDSPTQPAFYLSNGPDRPPVVHSLFEPSTKTWQHIVVDPATLHCVVIDPVCGEAPDENGISTRAADALLSIIREYGYIVDQLLETQSAASHPRSAVWYLRMQLASTQSCPPQIGSNGTVSVMERLFERKYGGQKRLVTAFTDPFENNRPLVVGRMRIYKRDVPGFRTPHQCLFVTGSHAFGGHTVAMVKRPSKILAQDMTPVLSAKDADSQLWTSMRTVLSLPENTRLYFSSGSANTTSAEPFHTVGQCRDMNEYVGLGLGEFLLRREGERRSLVLAEQALNARHSTRRYTQLHDE